MDIRGRVALVTGVGRQAGIGAAVCRALAEAGADIFYTYWAAYDKAGLSATHEDPAAFAGSLQALGVRAACVELDLSEAEAPHKLFAAAEAALGTPSILINNACHDAPVPFEELAAPVLDQHYFVNFRAPTLLATEFVRRVPAKGGVVVNLTSGQALGPMRPDQVPYTTTKAAVEMLALQLALHLKERNISVYALDPGPTDTGWISDELKTQLLKESAKGRIITPQEVAEALVSLVKNAPAQSGEVVHLER